VPCDSARFILAIYLAAVSCRIDFANGQAYTHDDGTTYLERIEDAYEAGLDLTTDFTGMQCAETAAAMVDTLGCSHALCSDRAHFDSFELEIQAFEFVQ
jgi:hypothetical protein